MDWLHRKVERSYAVRLCYCHAEYEEVCEKRTETLQIGAHGVLPLSQVTMSW